MLVTNIHPLAPKVLTVAVKRAEGWCAYCDAVPGKSHNREWQPVTDNGVKLQEEVARAIFPQYSGTPYIR